MKKNPHPKKKSIMKRKWKNSPQKKRKNFAGSAKTKLNKPRISETPQP